MKNNVRVEYSKFYADDIGKNIPNIFTDPDICCIHVNSYWTANVVDAFFSLDEEVNFTCVSGDARIIIANQDNKGKYFFKQYYVSSMDGKIIVLDSNTLFGVQSLTDNCVLISGSESVPNIVRRESNKIFKWASKRS
jgi:hypothetical protein